MKYTIATYFFVLSTITSFSAAASEESRMLRAVPAPSTANRNNGNIPQGPANTQGEDFASCFSECVDNFTGKGSDGASFAKFCRDEGETGQGIRACIEDNIASFFGENGLGNFCQEDCSSGGGFSNESPGNGGGNGPRADNDSSSNHEAQGGIDCFSDCVDEFTGPGSEGASFAKFCLDEGEKGKDIQACIEEFTGDFFGENGLGNFCKDECDP